MEFDIDKITILETIQWHENKKMYLYPYLYSKYMRQAVSNKWGSERGKKTSRCVRQNCRIYECVTV